MAHRILIARTHNLSPFVKDGIKKYIVNRNQKAVNDKNTGTKAAANYSFTVMPGKS
jgi:hypothetical protein